MTKKSQSFSIYPPIALTLLIVGAFLSHPGMALAASEASATTLPEAVVPGALPLAISAEVFSGSPVTISGELPNTTANDAVLGGGGGGSSGGGGGGGSSSGGSRSSSSGGRIILPQGQVLGVVTGCPEYLKKYIRQNRANDPLEVIKLQLFLRHYEGFANLAVTGVYDTPTIIAVAVFQIRHSPDVLGPWGISQPTGFVFVTTRLAINNIYCGRPTATNLDLRQVYDRGVEVGAVRGTSTTTMAAALAISQEIGDNEATTTTDSATTAVSVLKWDSGWWLVLLLLLAIVALGYFIWKLRPDKNYPRPLTDGEEIVIEEPEEETVTEQPPLDKF